MVASEGYDPLYLTHTYFVFPEERDKHAFPVISIVGEEDSFFGDRNGIYVPGNNYREGRYNTGNYYQRGRNWEREISFEFFEVNGERAIAQNAGVRIHGGTSRRYAHKSLRIYARSDYGESYLNHQIFPDLPFDSYKRLILRPSSQDQGHTMFKDAFAQHLVSHLNFDTQASRPSVVYINGEYWGIHNIRERFDDRYLERTYDVSRDEIDHLEDQHDVREGSNRHYRQMIDFVESNDLSVESNMERVKTMMDTESYLDYFSSQIYYVNFDWPHKNIQFWRSQTDYIPHAPPGLDGRWRWMMFDMDEIGRASCRERRDGHVTGVQTCALPIYLSVESNMERVKTMMDTESYLDYFSSQIYYVNFDWPHKNIQFWRSQTDYIPHAPPGLDGRWRWMMFDMDEAFRNPSSNLEGRNSMIDYLTRSSGMGGRTWANTLLRNLLENEQFKFDFINRMADLINTALHPDHVVSELDRFRAIYEPEMPEYINRWNR